MTSACLNINNNNNNNNPHTHTHTHTHTTLSTKMMHDQPVKTPTDLPEQPDPEPSDTVDFEFRLDEPVNILPADELFSDGKLFPLHFPVINHVATSTSSSSSSCSVLTAPSDALEVTVTPIINGVSVVDSFLYTPKAPKCASKWKELLGLKKLYQNSVTTSFKSSNSNSNGNGSTTIKSIKHFLYRGSKPSTDASVNLPLLNETDNEPATVTSRHSLSSSSSGHDPDDLPRLSLDSEKQLKNTNLNNNNSNNNNTRMKLVKTRTLSTEGPIRVVSTESPRMNSSGKIVFHSLERSSSSPSSFNGGVRLKNRGMERSYSGNVRITPVLNVPVCSLRGFPLFSSSQKHEGSSSSSNSNNKGGGIRNQQMNRNR